jgi:phytanoyl-CoA hydroxylase
MTVRASVSPATHVWDDDAGIRERGIREYFEEFGFAVIRGLLGSAEVAECLREIAAVNENRSNFDNVRVIGTRDPLEPSYDLEDASSDRPVIRKITGIARLSPVFDRYLVRNAPLLRALHLILGNRVELYRDALMMKSARVGQEKPWHQDAVYWPWRPMKLVSAMIALDESRKENAALQVIPGSHRSVRDHHKANWELQLELSEAELNAATYVELQPGDCLLFHSLLLHASENNRSQSDRRLAIISFSPGGLTNLSPDKRDTLLLSALADSRAAPIANAAT